MTLRPALRRPALRRPALLSPALAAAALLALAACGGRDDPAETAEAKRPAQAKGEAPGTAFALKADRASGSVEMAVPGARMAFDLPQAMFNNSDFDIDGTKLYPGSVVEGLDVRASDAQDRAERDSRVRIAFTAPAAPETVRAWFLSETANKDRPMRAAGDALVGSTRKGKAYRITTAPADGGGTRGEIVIEG